MSHLRVVLQNLPALLLILIKTDLFLRFEHHQLFLVLKYLLFLYFFGRARLRGESPSSEPTDLLNLLDRVSHTFYFFKV